MTKKSTGLTTTLTSDCEGVDCHKIEDAFFELQFEMKALMKDKQQQKEIYSNLVAERDEKNAAIFQLESIKQKQMALITNLQDKEDDNANKKITAALNANLTIQLANLKAELAKEDTIIANLKAQQDNRTVVNANLISQLTISSNIIANLTGELNQKNAIILSQQSQLENLNATVVDLQSQQRNQTAANSNLQFQLANQPAVNANLTTQLASKTQEYDQIQRDMRWLNCHWD